MSRLIGEAYISLLANADTFAADAKTKVDAALKGVKGDISLKADARDVDAKIAAIAAALKKLNGEAHVTVDTRGFIKDIATAKAALKGLTDRLGEIRMDADDSKFLAKMFGAKSVVDNLTRQLENMDADGDMNKLIGKVYGAKAVVQDLETEMSHLNADGDMDKMAAKLGTLGAVVKGLADELDHMRADADDAGLLAKITGAQTVVVRLAKSMRNMPLSADTLPLESDIFKAMALVEALRKQAGSIQIGPEIVPAVGKTVGTPAQFGSMSMIADTNGGLASYASMSKIAGMDAEHTAAVFERLNRDLSDTNSIGSLAAAALAKIASGQSMIISKGTGWGAWANQVRLFGGALDKVLPGWARAVSLWHLGLDVLFEFAAAWTPAIIAVGTFAAYAAPVAEKIYGQWKNINTILDGTGGSLKDLGTSFDTVEHAIEPGILAAFGEYMAIIGKNAGPMAEALKGVGNVVDDWGAAMVNWAAKASKSFDNVLHSGTGDFALIGAGFKSLFQIIGELIKDMPGIVHVLLPVGDAFLQITANVLKTLGPIVSFGLLIHGVMVYAGLATTAVIALGRAMVVAFAATFTKKTGIAVMGEEATVASGKFSKFGASIGAFAGQVAGSVTAFLMWTRETGALVGEFGLAETASSRLSDVFGKLPGVTNLAGGGFKVFGAEMTGTEAAAGGAAGVIAGAVVGALVYFAVKAYNAQSAAQKLNAELNKLIANSTSANFSQNLTIAFSKTGAAISKNESDLRSLTGTASVTSKTLTEMGPALANPEFGFSALGQKVVGATTNLNENQATLKQVTGYAENYGVRMNALAGIFGSTGAAQSALNLKGITAGQIAKESNSQFATQETILQGLAAGYGYMGQNVGSAAAQLNTLNISTGTVFKNVQALQQAESQWISTVTGGENAFTTFEQGQNTLNQSLGSAAKSAQNVQFKLGSLSEKVPEYGAKMTGLSNSSLAVRQAFDQQLSAGTTLWGNLQMLSTASGNTAKSQSSLGKAGKDIIAQLLPFAAGSKQATAEVSALAQVMGGPATDNFQTLAKWVGNTKGAEGDLNTQQAKLTISASNLTVAAKNLGNALETNLSQAEAAAIAKTFGLSNAIMGLASNVQKSGHAVNSTAVSMAGEYVSALRKAGESTGQATQDLNAYLAKLGYTPGQIKAIDSQLGDSAGRWNKYESAVNSNATAQKNFQKATAGNGAIVKNLGIVMGLGSTASTALWHAIVNTDQGLAHGGNQANIAKGQFAQFAVNGLGLSAAQADALWTKFGHQNLDLLAAKAGSTKNAFIDFAEHGLHLSSGDAQIMWKAFAQQNLDMMVTKGNNAKGAFIELAEKGLNLSRSSANDLWNTLKQQYLDTLAGKAGETKAAFEKTAAQFGLTKTKADNLWSSLHKLASGSPYGVNVNETLTGKGKLTAAISGTAVTLASTAAGAASQGNVISASNAVTKAAGGVSAHHAAGYMVPPGSGPAGQDSHLAMLAPGELVIPTSHAPAHMALAKKHGIPGLAGGGFAGAPGVAATAQAGVPTMTNAAEQVTATAMKQFAANISSAWAAKQAAIAGGPLGGATGSSLANGRELYNYLLTNLFHGNKIAAAGATASIWGESGWNPSSVGTGGRGLIGWTPIGTISDSAFSGGMRTQLPAIIQFVQRNGDMGAISQMDQASSVLEAANIWGKQVERYGINDVHPQGLSLAASFMSGGGIVPGNVKKHSAGGMVSEPVFGTGAWSGMPYSFAENGQPEYVGPLSGNQGQGAGIQPMTNIQGQQANSQLAAITKLLQQLPTTLAKAVTAGSGQGVRHGYYRAT